MQWLRQLTSRIAQSRQARQAMAQRAVKPQSRQPARRPSLRLEALEPRMLLSATMNAGLLSVTGSLLDDQVVINQTGFDAGGADISINLSNSLGSTSYSFQNVHSIDVQARLGADAITVASQITLGAGGELRLYGNLSGAPGLVDDLGHDSVLFASGVLTDGGLIEAFADSIVVAAGQVLDAGDADIVFRARSIDSTDLSNFPPLGVALRDVEIVVQAGAQLRGGGIYLIAQAEDRDLRALLGIDRLDNTFIVEPLKDLVSDLTALPVKVLFKQSEATISIGANAQLVGSGTVGMYATAASDASGQAQSALFSIGYAQAKATARVDLASGVLVRAGAAAVITSDANATASMATKTSQDLGDSGLAVSFAMANAEIDSRVTVAQGAVVEAGKAANVRSRGEIIAETEAESGTFADGTAGLAFGISFSKSNIHTQVDGTVIAHMDGPSLAEFFIDPTVTDPNKVGYIDYNLNMINVGGTSLVTEDTIEYDTRRGSPIGGLVDNWPYVVISLEDDPGTPGRDESQFIQLAATEQDAIDGVPVDLLAVTVPAVSNNAKNFDGGLLPDGAKRVNGDKDTVTLDNKAFTANNDVDFSLLGLTFELGQSIVYHEGTAPIDGLKDGKTYYVVTGINEFDLQGDNRFVGLQVIQFAETEAEARAGIAIDIGDAPVGATGYRIEAKHLIDSEFANGVGVQALLRAEDKASATAGLEDQANPMFALDANILDGTIFDTIVATLAAPASQAIAAGLQVVPVTVAGALAFAFSDHNASADIGSTAVLKSNQDLQVKATIKHEVQLSAESSIEPPAPDPANPNAPAPANAVSAAVSVGVFDNDALAEVHSGAQLDALLALRVISIIEHPYITSPDEFFPSTMAEFVDTVKTEGYDALNKYMDGTLGLKSGLFNSWARSTAGSDNVSVAGSVNVLTFSSDAEAIVRSGALLNQNLAWRSDASNPHPNQDNTPGKDADGYEGEQVVSIEASNYAELINMSGIFSLDLPFSGSITPTNPSFDPKLGINPVASEGGKGGVGGALFVMIVNNKTHATVEDGVQIYSGKDGGFNMKADEAIFNIDLGQAGAAAGSVSVGGTVLYNEQHSDTRALLSSEAIVTGRNASLLAVNLQTNVLWAGGISKGEAVGAGIAVAVNNIDRRTRALIGDEVDATPDAAADGATRIDVSEGVGVRALVGGQIWSFSVAGAVVSPAPDEPAAGAARAARPAARAPTRWPACRCPG